ncbi:MAG: MBL fold metallo-hydrolase [Bacillota bacterium]|jgi:hydroxyacylglutathione hydrolase
MNIGTDDLIIERMEVGPIGTNCYIVTNVKDKVTMVVDPGGSYSGIKAYLEAVQAEIGSKVVLLVNTHGHWDHIYHNADLLRDYPEAKLYIHKEDEPMLSKDYTRMVSSVKPTTPDGYLEDGMTLMLGSLPMRVFHTPGHSKGGVCILLKDKYLLAGDTLFKGSIGRTDLPGGSFKEIIESVRTKLLPLGDDVAVLPGHGPASTIGYEKENNMFL